MWLTYRVAKHMYCPAVFRNPETPGIPTESVPFVLWQAFTWVFDTTMTISRLIFAGVYDRHPRLKLIAHHGGALIPHFSGRLELLPTFSSLDPRLKEALERLQKPLIDYFKMLTSTPRCPVHRTA